MKTFLLVLTLVSSSAFAGFQKLTVQNLDLDYAAPYGKGMVEKVGIGMSLQSEPYPIEITRTDETFELTSPYVDFTWNDPLKFIHDIEKLSAKKTSAALGAKGGHFVKSDYFMFRPKGRGEFKAEKVDGKCVGDARGSFEDRMIDDCLNKLELTIHKIDVPSDVIMYKLIEGLQVPPEDELDIPADNVVAKIDKGSLYLQVYVKWIFYAGLRTWGHVQLENDRKVIAVRVDQIKFGYLPVTGIVMKKLKEEVKNPNIKIDPPWIRINIEGLK